MNNQDKLVYSDSFFEMSKNTETIDDHMGKLIEISKTIEDFSNLKILFENQNVPKNEKFELISSIFNNIDSKSLDSMKLMMDFFKDLVSGYKERYNNENNISEGVVYSVNPLDYKEIYDLERILEKKIGKKVILKNEIDESLISGISVYIDGKRIDNSIKNRLDNLKNSIKERRWMDEIKTRRD